MAGLCRRYGFDAAWVLAVGTAASVWCGTAWTRVGPTFDEPAHLNAGLAAWRTGSNKQLMTWGAMPLPIDVQTLPVYLMERAQGWEYKPYLQLDVLLPFARMASLPFFWVLLVYGLRWGRLLGGPWAGRLACALLASDPNLLGHAALATTDICLTASVLVATYHFFVGRDGGWKRRVLVPGLLYGIALTAKASALPYVPLLCGVLGLGKLWQAGRFDAAFTGRAWERIQAVRYATVRLRWDICYLMLIGLVWAFAYTGCDWGVEPTFVDWAVNLPAGALKDWMLPISEQLTIFPNAGEGLIQQVKHNFRGHGGAFLLGTYHPKAVWYYFPVALTVKLPDATLALLAATLLFRPRGLLTPAGLVALFLLAFSVNTRVQIGVRIVFPLVCFLYIALAAAAFRRPTRTRAEGLVPSGLGEEKTEGTSPSARTDLVSLLLRGLACLTVATNAAAAVAVWPDGVRYTNQLRGGTAAGDRQLADSNYDWGQGVPELYEWWRTHGEQPTRVWYYGGDTASMLPPFGALNVSLLEDRSPAAVAGKVGGCLFAVNVAILRACPDRRPDTLAVIEWLKGLEPVGRTGLFAVYRLPPSGR